MKKDYLRWVVVVGGILLVVLAMVLIKPPALFVKIDHYCEWRADMVDEYGVEGFPEYLYDSEKGAYYRDGEPLYPYNVEDLRDYLEGGGDSNAIVPCGDGKLPLIYAVIGDDYMVEEMIKHWVDVNAPLFEKHKEDRIIHYARSPKVLEFLIEAGADIEAKDWQGETILDEVVTYEGIEIGSYFSDEVKIGMVEALLKVGANVNAVDNDGDTLLHSLSFNCRTIDRNFVVAKMLVEAGADLNVVDSDGWTVLDSFVYRLKMENGRCDNGKLLEELTQKVYDYYVENGAKLAEEL